MKSKKLQGALSKLNSTDKALKTSEIEMITTNEAFKVVGGNKELEALLAPDCGSWSGSCGTWGGKCGSWS